MRFPLAIALVPLAALVAACGGGSDATQKQLDDLRNEVVKLRADNAALGERIDALELGKRAPRADAQQSGSDRPALDVVKLTPGAGDGDETEDATRPVVRVEGKAGSVVEDKSKKSAGPQRDFEDASELFRNKKYDKALDALGMFVQRYPSDPNIEAATYMRGEAYFAKVDYRRAAEQFDGVVTRFPKGTKAPDALLKLSQCYTRLGDKAKAEDAKQKLRTDYAGSDAAKKLGGGSGSK